MPAAAPVRAAAGGPRSGGDCQGAGAWGRPIRPVLRCAFAAWAAGWGLVQVAGSERASTPPADPPPPLQRQICYPPTTGKGKVRGFRCGQAVVWTDAPVDGPQLARHLDDVAKYLARWFAPRPTSTSRGATAPARRPGAVVVYADQSDYHALWRRVEAFYHGRFGPIITEGFSYRVFCATSYDDAGTFQRRRSVLGHEFAHVWLYQRLGLRNDGNWLTEGIATAVQLHFFPEAGDRADFARWLRTGRMIPLKRLMDLPRIRPKDYWQAATLVEVLRQEYGPRLGQVVAAFNEGKSAYRIVAEVLRTDFSTLRRQWTRHVLAATRPAGGRR